MDDAISHTLWVFNGIHISNVNVYYSFCIFIHMYIVRWKQIKLNWINKPLNKCRSTFRFQGFFSKFLVGGNLKILTGTKSDGGDLRKNLTEAKTAHLMQN